MRLRKEPKTISEANFLLKVLDLLFATPDRAVVIVGGRVEGRFFPRRKLDFRLEGEGAWRDMVCIRFEGPAISRYLHHHAKVLAFLNMQDSRRREVKEKSAAS